MARANATIGADLFEEGDVLETPAEILAPAYSALEEDESGNMSCSKQSNDFCFLCSYSGGDTDQLRDYIETLVKSGRELGAIAKAVHSVYNDSYRSECSHRKANGQIVDSPEWKLSSVRRHLLFTTNEAGSSVVFDDYVTQTLQHMIIHQNKVVRPSTGEVDEDGRKSLCNSIETLMKWRSHVRDTRCGKKTSRK